MQFRVMVLVGKRHCRLLTVGKINSHATEFDIILFPVASQ
jgi:hypothetical protein